MNKPQSKKTLSAISSDSDVLYPSQSYSHNFSPSNDSKTHIEKMEKVLKESGKKSLDKEHFKSLARGFNRAKGRAGKPILKWTEIQRWFQNKQQDQPSNGVSPSDPVKLAVLNKNQSHQVSKGENVPDLSELEFEARSKDGAWYDVETFLTHRILSSGETEVRVRYAGFGSDEDEWVNVKRNVRLRSVPLEHSECGKIKVGDLVVCFQERNDEARYYDAHVVEIQRKLHDIRGCRCLFLIRYDHDNTEESVRLRRLCCQPTD